MHTTRRLQYYELVVFLVLLVSMNTRAYVVYYIMHSMTYDTTLQRLAASDVAHEISLKNSEDIGVCLWENRRIGEANCARIFCVVKPSF